MGAIEAYSFGDHTLPALMMSQNYLFNRHTPSFFSRIEKAYPPYPPKTWRPKGVRTTRALAITPNKESRLGGRQIIAPPLSGYPPKLLLAGAETSLELP